jgi:hypothetical protein
MSFGLPVRNGLGLGLRASTSLATRSGTPLASFNFASGTYLVNGISYPLASAPGWTFSRTTSGYGTDAAGVMTSFAIDAPRVTDVGLLIEAAKTNTLPRSEPTLAQLAVAGNVTNVAAPATVPFTAAQWLALTNTAGTAFAYQTGTHAATTAYAWSVFVEVVGGGAAPVVGSTQTAPEDFSSVIGGTLNTITGLTTTQMTGNVWRVSWLQTSVGAGGNTGLVRYVAQNQRVLKFTGIQLELVPTSSYFPTTGAAAARGADVASLTFTNGSFATVTYGSGLVSVVPVSTSLNLGASGGGAWVGSYVQSVVVR